MKIRVITSPGVVEGEADQLNALFAEGLHGLHVRKPEWMASAVETLMSKIMPSYRSRIMLHSHFDLADAYPVRGFHFPESYRLTLASEELQWLVEQWQQKGKVISTSVHHPQTLPALPPDFDEVLVSPVFESISKAGYLPTVKWNICEMQQKIPFHLIGLGGIEVARLAAAAQLGFTEVAVLGALWNEPEGVLARFLQLQEAAQAL